MDAGLAAVCGALAGAAGAVGAAFMTSRAQWKGARLAARAEHVRQRRDERAERYRDFHKSALEFGRVLNRLSYNYDPAVFTSRFGDAVVDANELCQVAGMEVHFSGPRSVGKAVRATLAEMNWITNQVRYLCVTSRDGMPSGGQESFAEMQRAIEKVEDLFEAFSLKAADALDDYGERRPR
ncbi:hypothetical protein [Streptomyces sp. NPDC093111]|uniref:hypothetical protein n=1 Tax=Streptomyces sp. NPDC093111 TaxID=3154978 RepID=UPI00343C5D95